MTVETKRVYELAKEYEMSNKEFIEYLDSKLGIKVKSHSSNLMPAQIEKIKAALSKNNGQESAKKPKAFIIKKPKTSIPEEKKEDSIKKTTESAENKKTEIKSTEQE